MKRILLGIAVLTTLLYGGVAYGTNTYFTEVQTASCERMFGKLDSGRSFCNLLNSWEAGQIGTGGAAAIGFLTTPSLTTGATVQAVIDEVTTSAVDGALKIGAATTGLLATSTTLRAQLNEVCTSGTDGADNIGAAAKGLLTTSSTLRAQLDEICTSAVDGSAKIGATTHGAVTGATVADQITDISGHFTALKNIPISITSLDAPTGAATSKYGDGAAAGFYQVGGKEVVYKADNAADAPVAFSIMLPYNWGTGAWEVHVVSLGDAAGEAIDVECWMSRPADINNTDIITQAELALDATIKEYVFAAQDGATYSAANAAASFAPTAANPVFLTCEITLNVGDFDIELYSVWIEYTGAMQ
jgi:hypothetical protein